MLIKRRWVVYQEQKKCWADAVSRLGHPQGRWISIETTLGGRVSVDVHCVWSCRQGAIDLM